MMNSIIREGNMNIYVLTNTSWDGYRYRAEIQGYTEVEGDAKDWVGIQKNTDNDYYGYEEVMKYEMV